MRPLSGYFKFSGRILDTYVRQMHSKQPNFVVYFTFWTGTEVLGCLTSRRGAPWVWRQCCCHVWTNERLAASRWQSRPMTWVACQWLGVGAPTIRLRSRGIQSHDGAWDPVHKSTLGEAWPGGEGILLWQQVEESVQHCAKLVFYLSTCQNRD